MEIEALLKVVQKGDQKTQQTLTQGFQTLNRGLNTAFSSIAAQNKENNKLKDQSERQHEKVLKELSNLKKDNIKKEQAFEKRRDKADFEFKNGKDKDSLDNVEEHLEEISELLSDLVDKDFGGQKKGLGGLLGNMADFGKVLGPASKGLLALTKAVAPFAAVAGAGALGLYGLKKLGDHLYGDGKIDNNGNASYGTAQVFDHGEKGAQFASNLDADNKADMADSKVSTSVRTTNAVSHRAQMDDGKSSDFLKELDIVTPAQRKARRTMYQKLMDDLNKEEEDAIKNARTFESAETGSRKTGRKKETTDLKKIEQIEEEFEERRRQLVKNYESEGLSSRDKGSVEPKLYQGGMFRVPGMGSGDKVPANLAPGDFVLNRNASNHFFPKYQQGGTALVEPGEMVFPSPSKNDSKTLTAMNKSKPRMMHLQEGGEATDDGSFVLPLEGGRMGTGPGQIFGAPRDGRTHVGLDLVEQQPWGADPKIKVLSSKSGVVSNEKYSNDNYTGGMIVKQDDGYDARYVHMSNDFAKPGDRVQAGTPLGKLLSLGDGGSSSHLHYELYKRDSTTPLDPTPYLSSAGAGVPGAPASGGGGMSKDPDGPKGGESGPSRPDRESGLSLDSLQKATSFITNSDALKTAGAAMKGLMTSGNILGALAAASGGAALAEIVPALKGILGGGARDPNVSEGQSSGGSGSTSYKGGGAGNEKGVKVAKSLMSDVGITADQAAGIAGNFLYESSGMKPDVREGGPYSGNSYSWPAGKTKVPAGYGWAQWSFKRHDRFVNEHLGGFNGPGGVSARKATDADNYAYLVKEFRTTEKLSGRSDGRPDQPTEGVVPATDWFRAHWERAGVKADEPRRAAALEIRKELDTEKLQSGGMMQGHNALLEPGEMVFKQPNDGDLNTLRAMNGGVARFQTGGTYGKNNSVSGVNDIMKRFKDMESMSMDSLMKQQGISQQVYNINQGMQPMNVAPNSSDAALTANLPNEPTSHIAATLMMQQYTLSSRIG